MIEENELQNLDGRGFGLVDRGMTDKIYKFFMKIGVD